MISVSWRSSLKRPPSSVLAVAQICMRALRMASSTSALLVVVWMVRMVSGTQRLGGGIGMGSMFSSGVGVPMGAPGSRVCASVGSVLESVVDLASGLPLVGKGVGTRVPRLWGPPRSSSTRE